MSQTKIGVGMINATSIGDAKVLQGNGAWVTPATSGFTQATEQATTSGGDVTFSSIPAGVKMIVISFMGFSEANGYDLFVQLGDSGGIETSGYLGDNSNIYSATAATSGSTTDSMQVNIMAAADVSHGTMILTLGDAQNTWTQMHVLASSQANKVFWGAAAKTLSGELTQLKIGAAAGTMDAGSVNIMYQ